ncbi:MAG: M36 family metallopeptidase [Actinomycetota bacterium]|nr:M36 family metallopeptidase [Actinomycetota bacterium]
MLPSSSLAIVQLNHDDVVEEIDVRNSVVDPTAEQLQAVQQLGASVRWNQFGTPQSLINYGGHLATGVSGASAEAAARNWLGDNAMIFKMGSVDRLELLASVPMRGSNGHAVVFGQRVDGLLVVPDGSIQLALVDSGSNQWKVTYVSSSLIGDDELTGSSELSQVEALQIATENVGVGIAASEVEADGRDGGYAQYEVEGLAEPQLVRQVAFPMPGRGAVRAFETNYGSDDLIEGYRHIIDAETGDVLYRDSFVHNAVDNPTWKVFDAYPQITPLNSYPWNYPSADTRDLWCWVPMPGCQLAVANQASPREWDVNARTNTPTFTTTGNNNDAFELWFAPTQQEPAGATNYRPTSPTRDYQYPWTNVWFETKCDEGNFEPGVGNDISAATANLFAMHNRMHDWSYNLGFTEQTWNAQDFNFGKPFLENDELLGRAQSGAVAPKSRDNANMGTRPDGINSVTNMYLWQPLAAGFYAPCVDGDYDMSVIGHEFGHMVENRMISKGVGSRQGAHAGAMGESSGDLMGMEYLNEYNFLPVGGEQPSDQWGTAAVGPYVTGNPTQGIRNYNMSFRSGGDLPSEGVNPWVNALNFSDVGYDIVGPQVHADGEIWSATNYDIRELFMDRYGVGGTNVQRECADGERPVQTCPGNRRWVQLMFDAYLLMPRAPTFLDARDAMLAADVARFGGANQDIIWLGFARRGFGSNATTTNFNDTEPRGGWESPLQEEATLTFNAVAKDEGNAPIANARFYVGDYEARVTPIERVTRFVPDDSNNFQGYNFIAHAPGYGHVRFHVKNLDPGEARTITVRFPTNHASQSKGAVATGDGENHNRLIDDTEGTNWQALGAPVQGRQVVVQFAGPRSFSQAKVSAMLVPPAPGQPSQSRFSALRQFELYACTAGGASNPTCAGDNDDGWRRITLSTKDAFPSVNPRPTVPTLTIRKFEVPTTTATHVRLVVLHNQCTGQDSYHGEQDNDESNPTECRGTSAAQQVRAAELQILSSRPEVQGAFRED